MNFKMKYIDELIAIREEACRLRNWVLSDGIRDYLDTKKVFVFDTPNGQEVYHRNDGSREDLIKEIKKEQSAQRLFDSWLYSMRSSINHKAYKK